MEKVMVIPNGCCEKVKNELGNCFKVLKKVLDFIPKKGTIINVLFNGTGFMYHGEIYNKSNEYVYFYLY